MYDYEDRSDSIALILSNLEYLIATVECEDDYHAGKIDFGPTLLELRIIHDRLTRMLNE